MEQELVYFSIEKLEQEIISYLFEISYFENKYNELEEDACSITDGKNKYYYNRRLNFLHSLLATTVSAGIISTMEGVDDVGLKYGMYAATAIGYFAFNRENRKEYKSLCDDFDNKYQEVGRLFAELAVSLGIYIEILKSEDAYNFDSPIEVVADILYNNRDYINSLKTINNSKKNFNFNSICKDIEDFYGLEYFNKEVSKSSKKFVRVKNV